MTVHCEQIERAEVAERYLRGALSEDEQAAYEAHYFECASCFQALTHLRTLQAALAADAVRPAVLTRLRPRPWHGAVAAGLVACLAFVVFQRQTARDEIPSPAATPQQTPPPLPERQNTPPPAASRPPEPRPLPALAQFAPPPYVTLDVRAEEGALDKAMAHYTRGEYPAAAAGLRALAMKEPRAATIHFYLGVSELMAGRSEEAIGALETAAAHGRPEVAEHAYYLLAQVWLTKSRAPEARRALELCVGLRGAHAAAAAELLTKLPS